jgi:CRISPR system Cascade subunit CasE
MYLSRITVATEGLDRTRLMGLLSGNAYGNHQLLWRLFTEHGERPFLFRQELEGERCVSDERRTGEGHARGMPLFYVLSCVEPQPVPGLLEAESKAFDPKLATGQELAFRLRANPCVARREEGRRRSRRHDVLMDAKRQARQQGTEDQATIRSAMDRAAIDWLADEQRSQEAGYELLSEPRVDAYQQHSYRRKGHNIRFSSVDYEGILRVRDPERFRACLQQGIGRSRAFGCGLWLIKRA